MEDLGDVRQWQVEWKWDGIRAQLIRRQWRTFLWSRGEELITDRFPELEALGALLPEGTVIDGEVMPWKDGAPLPFAQMQRRIGRKVLGPKILAEVPVVLVGYDLLELNGQDVREQPLEWRRAQLAQHRPAPERAGAVAGGPQPNPGTNSRGSARNRAQRKVEGFMLKRLGSPYRVGRRRGDWWKWKIEPYSVDAVLIYAQPGNGRRASLFTDYTFGIWDNGKLVPFAKAYSGLSDEEIREVDAFVRRNTIETLRTGACRQTRAGLRAGLRRHPAFHAPPLRHCRAFPAHGPLAPRQKAGRRRHHRNHSRAAGMNASLVTSPTCDASY